MKKSFIAFASTVFLLSGLRAQAVDKAGSQRTFACTAEENSLIWNLELKYVSSIYATPGISILLPKPLERGTRYVKAGNVLGLDKRRVLNVEINHVENSQNHSTVSASIAAEDAGQSSFQAVVETVVTTQGRATATVANFSCKLIEERELSLGER